MKVRCIKGYYKFYPEKSLDLTSLKEVFGYNLLPVDEYYTFPVLARMDYYSIEGQSIGGLTATANYAGKRSDVLEANAAVYNVESEDIKLLSSINIRYAVELDPGYYYAFTNIPQAGGKINDKVFTSFSAYIDFSVNVIRVSDIW